MASVDQNQLQLNSVPSHLVDKSALSELFEIYLRRQNREDLDYLQTTLKLESLEALLKTDFRSGIPNSQEDHLERARLYGRNDTESVKVKNFCQFLCEALNDFMLKLLICLALLSLVANFFIRRENRDIAWLEGFAILFAVALVAMVGALSDWRREIQFQRMNQLSESNKMVRVLRAGSEQIIHQSQLLVGDLVQIQPGMKIPVDGVIIRSNGVSIDESSLTGESNLIKKADLQKCEDMIEREHLLNPHSVNAFDNPSPVLLSETTVNQGQGLFLVLVVGANTVSGKIEEQIMVQSEATPLQRKLEILATQIGKIGIMVGLVIFIVLVTRYFIEESTEQGGLRWKSQHLIYILKYLTIGTTIVVVAVPEGIPMAVAISLAFSVNKMIQDKNFVKKLKSCELMGSVSVICSDKTGTLTRNQNYVTDLWMGKAISVKQKEYIQDWPNPQFRALLFEAIACNSIQSASQIEKALLSFIESQGADVEKFKNQGFAQGITRYLFTARRKRMSTILNKPNYGFGRRIHMKGAAQRVLRHCTWYIDQYGNRLPLTEQLREYIQENAINSFARRALRLFCLAYKEIEPEQGLQDSHQVDPQVEDTGFTCLAFLGLKDILHANVPAALEQSKAAGIRVIMVTGDNGVTALQIARECGLVSQSQNAEKIQMSGAEFNESVKDLLREFNTGSVDEMESSRHRNIEEFARITKDLKILSRARPQDKYLLVNGLKLMNEVVAVTGDGTNDVPALYKAHVGLAMGIRGTSIAKEAADMIILDDNYQSVVNAVAWGRNIYNNIKRFLQFQLTANSVTMLVTLVDSFIIEDSVLTPMQLLWVNLMMDSLASLALATGSPSESTLASKPVNMSQSILSSSMKMHILIQSIYQSFVIFGLVFLSEYIIPEQCSILPKNPINCELVHSARIDDYSHQMKMEYGAGRHFTLVFNALVWMQLFNEINSREINHNFNVFSGLSRNRLFILVWMSTALTQVFLIEFGGDLFGVSRNVSKLQQKGLSKVQWVICIGFGMGCLVLRVVALSIMKLCNHRQEDT